MMDHGRNLLSTVACVGYGGDIVDIAGCGEIGVGAGDRRMTVCTGG
jgi:hypothetical protein